MKSKLIITGWIILVAMITGCFESGTLDSASKDAGIVQLKQISTVYYDLTDATVVVSGLLKHDSVTLSNNVQFYTTSNCTGTPVGQGSYENFLAGLELKLSSQHASPVYLKTNTLAYCMYLTDFSATFIQPVPPIFSNFNPATPSATTSTPLIFGQTAIRNYQVQFFKDAFCTLNVGTGTAEMFSTTGILLVLAQNQTTPIYGQTTDVFGKKSICQSMNNFTHSSLGPTVPVFSTTDPLSPNKITEAPVVKGVASTTTVTVSIYSDAGCVNQVGTGLKADFQTNGISVGLNTNATTQLYGKAFDAIGRPSACTYLTSYTHDDIAPATIPQFVSANPASPTRLTNYPKIKGTVGVSDTVSVILYNTIGCLTPIGTGTKLQFETSGIFAGVTPNSITSIYAVNVDASGNRTTCTYLLDYKHNTIPPPDAVFSTSNPISPNNVTASPIVIGNADVKTLSVAIYNNDTCTNLVGSGPGATFDTAGILVTLPVNTISTLYSRSTDSEGNVSTCSFLTTYAYSNLPAPVVSFSSSSPNSPNRISTNPYFIGAAGPTITLVRLYDDNSCSNLIGQSSRLTFVTTGIRTTVSSNTNTTVYAKSTDVYGNDSACTLFTNYIHCNVVPDPPTFLMSNPVSPNRTSITPLISGGVTQNLASILPPTGVSLYDSFLCLNRIGNGTQTEFTGSGVQAVAYANALVGIYAKVYDAAGNYSNCTSMLDYIHDSIAPGATLFISANPASPSYTENTLVKGSVSNVSKVLPVSAVNIYSENTCTSLLSTGSKATFTSTGIPLTVPLNAGTTFYGQSTDDVGNKSLCLLLTTFNHKNTGPLNLTLTQNLNGSIDVTWSPDTFGFPVPTYQIKRSLISGGPYTIIVPNNMGNNFTDNSVNLGETYYYVVAATNITGTTFDSAEAQITVSSGNPDDVITLIAKAESEQIDLSWSGFPTDMNFKIYRGTTAGGPYTMIASKILSSIYYDKTAINGLTYYYVVVGVNPAGNSMTSTEASVTTLDIPPAPTNLTVTRLLSAPACGGGVGNYLSWTASPYYDRFSVNRGSSTGSNSLLTKVTSNSFVDCSNFNPNTSTQGIFYTVQADWGGLQSAESNEVSVSFIAEVTLNVAPGDSEIFLTWTNIPTSLSYDVYRSLKYDGPFTLVSTGSPGAGYHDTAVVNNTAYFYYVTAVFSVGYNAPSIIKSGVPGVAGGAPSNLKLFVDQNNLPNLDWTAPQKYNSFNVYRASTVGGVYSFIGQALTNTSLDSSPLVGMNFYKVSAVWGSAESAMTGPVSFRNGVPGGITISSNTVAITVSWNAVPTASNYNLFRSTTAGGPYTLVSAVATSPYVDSSVVLGTGYYYVVQAGFVDATTGQLSAEVNAMTKTTNVPTGLSMTAMTTSSLTLKWTAVQSATKYKIFSSSAIGGPYVQEATMPTTTNYTFNGLSPVVNVYIKIKSVVSGTDSGFSAMLTGQTITLPDAPTGLVGNNSIDLTWNLSNGATAYDLERSTNGTSFTTVASGIPSTSYTDATAVNGVLYYYRLKAYYGIGNYYSPNSLAMTAGITPIVPRGLTVTDNSTGTDLEFAWAGISGVTAFKLYQATSSGGPYSLATNTSSISQVVISSLTPDTTYYFVLTALNGLNESAYSSEVSVQTTAQTAAPLTKAVTPTQIDLTWTAVAGAATYSIYRSSDSATFSMLASGVVGTAYSDTTVLSGYTYKYQYRSFTALPSPMAYSAVSAWTTTTLAPLAPVGLIAQTNSLASVDLSWVPTPNCSFYNIYRGTTTGGPYTLLNSIASSATTYSDNTVVGGTSYFYMIRAESISGVESLNSNEAIIKMTAGPVNLVASLAANKIHLTWDPVAGATGYTVRRGFKTGGPYGILANAIAGTSFNDVLIEHGINYFYVVDAEFANGAISVHSNEATIAAIDTINLQVPIELLDRGIWSQTTTSSFLRSKTSFNTDFYDGTITYGWQILAENFSLNPVTVELINETNTVVGSIVVPGSTPSWTRFAGTFVPTAGEDYYRLQIQATGNDGDVQISSARLLITQQQATKTRIYIPLSASSTAATSSDVDGFLDETAAITYQPLPSASIYQRDTSVFSKLADYNAWELETVVAGTNGARGRVILVDQTVNNYVGRTQGQFNSANPVVVRSSFDEGETNFAATNENDFYQVSILCEQNCTAGKVRLYKAGLWVNLTSLTKAEVYFRTALGAQLISSATDVTSRSRVQTAQFSNPLAFFQTVGQKTGLDDGQVTLLSHGNQQSGLSGSVAAAPTLTINSNLKTYFRTNSFAVPADETYITDFVVGTQPINIVDSILIIRFTK